MWLSTRKQEQQDEQPSISGGHSNSPADPTPVGFYHKRCTDSIVYELQEDRGMSGLAKPEPNDEDRTIDVLNVCIRLLFEASSYNHIA